MASQVVQLYSNSFSWCVTSSLGTQYDSFSIEPRSFRQTFWLLLTKQCKKKPQYLSLSLWYIFCHQYGENDQKATQQPLPLVSFLYSILSSDLSLSGLKSPRLFYFMRARQINGVDIVLSSRLLNIRVPKKIIFLRVKM